MRNSLPRRPWTVESGIVNLDDKEGPGTHWVAYKKQGCVVKYFDSYGDLRPPMEVLHYFRGNKILYNDTQHQYYNTIVCGHLCLKFLYTEDKVFN